MDRREELAAGATAWVVEHGLADLSLRPLAAALGTSDRMLIHHFGTKDGLIAEVVARAADLLQGAFGPLERASTPSRLVEAAWDLLVDPAVRPAVALLIELHVLALRRGEPYRSAAEAVDARWVAFAADRLVAVGVPPRRAPAAAQLLVGGLDGLALLHLGGGVGGVGRRPPGVRALAAALEAATVRG